MLRNKLTVWGYITSAFEIEWMSWQQYGGQEDITVGFKEKKTMWAFFFFKEDNFKDFTKFSNKNPTPSALIPSFI